MKPLLLAGMMAVFLGGDAFAGASLQQANVAERSPLTREHALQAVWRAPNFRVVVTALKNSGYALDFGEATFVPIAEGSKHRILVIRSKGGSKVVEASFDVTTLVELVLVSPPNTVVNVLEGTVQIFNLTRRSIRYQEGKWRGTGSLGAITTIAPSTRNN